MSVENSCPKQYVVLYTFLVKTQAKVIVVKVFNLILTLNNIRKFSVNKELKLNQEKKIVELNFQWKVSGDFPKPIQSNILQEIYASNVCFDFIVSY